MGGYYYANNQVLDEFGRPVNRVGQTALANIGTANTITDNGIGNLWGLTGDNFKTNVTLNDTYRNNLNNWYGMNNLGTDQQQFMSNWMASGGDKLAMQGTRQQLNDRWNAGLNAWQQQQANQGVLGTGMSGFQLGQLALQGVGTLWGMYQGNKQMKLAQQQFQEQKALNHANFRNQAKAMNAQYRDQASGRGYVGMSSAAKQALGVDYRNRRVEEDY